MSDVMVNRADACAAALRSMLPVDGLEDIPAETRANVVRALELLVPGAGRDMLIRWVDALCDITEMGLVPPTATEPVSVEYLLAEAMALTLDQAY